MRGRRRSQLVADRAQYPDTRRQREPVAIDDVIELTEQRRGLVVGQIELHAPNVGSLLERANRQPVRSFYVLRPYWPIFGQFPSRIPIRY